MRDEVTEEMRAAGRETALEHTDEEIDVAEIYLAMRAAAPPSPVEEDEVERVAQAMFDEQHYAYEEPTRGYLAKQHPDDIERARRQARAAIAAMDRTSR